MPATATVAPGLVLDGRLALFHQSERWLAVADLHYGYELTKRLQGGLFPLWGMETVAARLAALLDHYRPETLVLAGDLVDGAGPARDAASLIDQLRNRVPGEVVCLAGNHDRGTVRQLVDYRDEFETPGFRFHHGDVASRLASRDDGRIQVTGHLHPTVHLCDGAGLSLRLPALVCERTPERGERWVLPAFSPWAGGRHWTCYPLAPDAAAWACSPRRVFPAAGGPAARPHP